MRIDGTDRGFLNRTCQLLEARHPGVLAGFEDFETSYLGGPRDGFLVVEVFNVADHFAEELLAYGENLASKYFDEGGRLVSFNLWTPEETRDYFGRDILRMQMNRVYRRTVTETVHMAVGSSRSLFATSCEFPMGRQEECSWTAVDKGVSKVSFLSRLCPFVNNRHSRTLASESQFSTPPKDTISASSKAFGVAA